MMDKYEKYTFDKEYIEFSNIYLTEKRSNDECDLITSIIEGREGTGILDLGCGTGRISKNLAGRGYIVTGIDCNEIAIKKAKRNSKGDNPLFTHANFLEMNYDSTFDAVISWYTSFGYYDECCNNDLLSRIQTSLVKGGVFILDHPNRDLVLKNFQKITMEQYGDNIMIDEREYNPLDGFLYQKRTFIINGSMTKINYKIRLYTYTEIKGLLHYAGFYFVEGMDERKNNFTPGSKRMIIVARK